jgi:histidinol-phosphate aminotransferase
MADLKQLVRPHILGLKPYSSARDEYSGKEGVFLDANENPYSFPSYPGINRYPDPMQMALKGRLSELKGVPEEHFFIGNGSDEVIDLLIRAFCEPGKDRILILPPTYGMYEVSAGIHNVGVKRIPLDKDFQPNVEEILQGLEEEDKLLFLCSPNNPSGNLLDKEKVEALLEGFPGIVVLDEAYIDFAPKGSSLAGKVMNHPRLLVMQTLSKAYGMAGLRLGIGIAHPDLIAILNLIKPPYNVNVLSQQAALDKLDHPHQFEQEKALILAERKRLAEALSAFPQVRKIYPSDANFLLVKIDDARGVYERLLRHFVILRDRSRFIHCEDCVRITVGTIDENNRLLEVLPLVLPS